MSYVGARTHGILGLIVLLGLASAVLGQDAAQVTGGRRLVETERKTIFFTMHPTATLTRTDYDGARQLRDGFVLTYTFNFKGIGGNYYSKMDFVFNDRGRFLGLKTNDTSSLIEPFFASDLAMGVLKDMVKDDFELKKDGAMAKALDAADSKLVLELMLTYKQSKLRAAGAEVKDEELIKLIRGSESMNDKERQEWINLLPRMTAQQRAELTKILVNERDQLAEIDRKYQKEIDAIGKKQQETERGYNLLVKRDYRGAVDVLSGVLAVEPKNAEALFFRGQAFESIKDHKAAAADYSAVIELAPKSVSALNRRAHCHYVLKNYRNAYVDYARSAELDAKSPLAMNNLAWFLATCPEAKFRDGKEAVEYATKACEFSKWKEPMYFDTLAAAYAESGDFSKAVEWQAKALADPAALEKAVGKEELDQARRRLDLFKEKKPFREIR
jgi:Tfp pilus assembly protein PilF